MRYWVLVKEKVVGPYPPEELERLPAFGARTLVCPEDRGGSRKDDWQPASAVLDLSPAFEPGKQSQEESATGGMARHAGLLDRIAALTGTVSRLEDDLRRKKWELTVVRKHAEDQALEAVHSKEKSARLEARVGDEARQRAALERALAELKDQVTRLQAGAKLIDQVEELERDSAKLREELSRRGEELEAKAKLLADAQKHSEARRGLISALAGEVERLKEDLARLQA